MTRMSSHRILDYLGRYGLVLLLVGILILFGLLNPDTYLTGNNVKATLDQQSVVLLAAFAAMLPLIIGEFDLSVAANTAFGNVFVVGFATNQGLPPALAIVLAIAICTTVGLANGLIVTKLQVESIVATLGMATLLGGIALLYANETDIFSAPKGLTDLGRSEIAGIPAAIIYAAVASVIMLLILQFSAVGRKMLAVGGNRRAAQLTGISPTRYTIGAFTGAGFIAGIAGVILGAQSGSVQISNNGGTLLLPVFAAVFLGATTIHPGRPNVVGTIIAVCFLAFTVTGLQQLGVELWIQPVVNGLALIVAVALSAWALRLRAARLKQHQLSLLAETAEAEAKSLPS